jgi:exportin-1
VCGLLSTSFPNMTPVQIQAAVAGMMAIEDKRAFKHHMRDFLVQVRGLTRHNNTQHVLQEPNASASVVWLHCDAH